MKDYINTTCDRCDDKGENIIQVEYPHDHSDHYDGISETVCLICGTRIGRWSGKELDIGEYEKYPVRRKKRLKNKDIQGLL